MDLCGVDKSVEWLGFTRPNISSHLFAGLVLGWAICMA